jgi:hypothetical protein
MRYMRRGGRCAKSKSAQLFDRLSPALSSLFSCMRVDVRASVSAAPPGTPFSTVPSATLWSVAAPPVLWTGEPNGGYNPRNMSDLFPLSSAPWIGRAAPTPKESHVISQAEFGHYGGSYMTAQVFRGDCFHNFFQLRYFY